MSFMCSSSLIRIRTSGSLILDRPKLITGIVSALRVNGKGAKTGYLTTTN